MPTMALQGTSGALSRVEVDTRAAASPMISMQRIAANSVFLSVASVVAD